jgi:hypothetical protein
VSRFQFAHGRWCGPLQAARRRTIAAKYEAQGVRFVNEREPGLGGRWLSYFDAPARGYDHDVALVREICTWLP